METKFVGNERGFKVPVREGRDRGSELVTYVLWGDPVHIEDEDGEWTCVRARGHRPGWIRTDALTTRSLLEIYVIDVGQGDGVLMKTPDGKWHLVDAGVENSRQMTRKGAANFIRWKFLKDLQRPRISLASVILTHPDGDHFGGLLDLFSGFLPGHDPFEVEVGAFYHAGLGRFAAAPQLGASEAGEVAPFPHAGQRVRQRGKFIVELLEGKESFVAKPGRPFDGRSGFARLAAEIAERDFEVRRLSYLDGHLPGYAPGESGVTIKLLGPIVETFAPGRAGLRVLGSDDVTRNGHSIVLRLDYGQARILLTGDLNTQSQRLLLSYEPEEEFAVDVAKACHHGSEEVHVGFTKAMKARATVISSGDDEDYAHPRPVLMGASARYGRESKGLDEDLAPLVYSTELARAVKLERALAVAEVAGDGQPAREGRLDATRVKIAVGEQERFRSLRTIGLAADLVYGLVNVRTDGEYILCATLEEKGKDFDAKVFRAGIDV